MWARFRLMVWRDGMVQTMMPELWSWMTALWKLSARRAPAASRRHAMACCLLLCAARSRGAERELAIRRAIRARGVERQRVHRGVQREARLLRGGGEARERLDRAAGRALVEGGDEPLVNARIVDKLGWECISTLLINLHDRLEQLLDAFLAHLELGIRVQRHQLGAASGGREVLSRAQALRRG